MILSTPRRETTCLTMMSMRQASVVLLLLVGSVAWGLSVCEPPPTTFVILGGTGKIGTAVATHLLEREPSCHVILCGRNEKKGKRAIQQVVDDCSDPNANIEWKYIDTAWEASSLHPVVDSADCLIHTAGPYLNQVPIPLEVAIASSRCQAYVDVSDPLDYIDASLKLSQKACDSGTSALLAAGAFPGMSNVLAMEAAATLNDTVQDLRFNYFTAGLGGSGDVNLYITNLGFGEPMAQFDTGKLRFYKELSGRLLGKVSFSISEGDETDRRLGSQTVFSWPFPEAATVARELQIAGDSSAAMGTAPEFWNIMLGFLVRIVPRSWWRSEMFSKFMADFSRPLVKATDSLLLGGETHGMRVDVTSYNNAISVVQAHDSFRRCVGQSCAEFALDLVHNPYPGVYLPEQRYGEKAARKRIIEKLTSTPGTFCYSGPVEVSKAHAPTDLNEALRQAIGAEKISS